MQSIAPAAHHDGLLRDRLIRHFHQQETIEQPELKHLIWQNNIATSKILIESVYRWKPQDTESRPAILIKRNAYQNFRAGVGDRHQGPPADRRGDPHYTTFWLGSHTLFCVGGTGAQAELLTSEVVRELSQFGPLVRKELRLHQFRVMEVGEISKLEEAEENFVSPVTVGYAYADNWTLLQQAPPLRIVSLSLITEF